ALAKIRGESQTNGFYLATNMDGIGAFDDVVLSYDDCKKEKRVFFLQAKHVENKKNKRNKITFDKFIEENNKFYLGKYLSGYLKSKKEFNVQSTDPVFKGNFQDLDCH